MALPQETLESLSKDVQSNPEHVAQQSTEALASVSAAAAEMSSEKPMPQAATRDEEGIPNTFEQHTKDEGATKQKKIAVLTSGGDSAGMNAAGELRASDLADFSPRCRSSEYCPVSSAIERWYKKLIRSVAAKPTSSAKVGKVSFAATRQNLRQHPHPSSPSAYRSPSFPQPSSSSFRKQLLRKHRSIQAPTTRRRSARHLSPLVSENSSRTVQVKESLMTTSTMAS